MFLEGIRVQGLGVGVYGVGFRDVPGSRHGVVPITRRFVGYRGSGSVLPGHA